MTIAKLQHLFYSFEGRIGRQSYWLGILAVLAVLALLAFAGWYTQEPGRNVPQTILILVIVIVLGLVTWPILALSTKRLHDRNRSAWWLIPFVFAPRALDKWNDKIPEETPLWWATLAIGMALGLWGLIELGFLKGSAGANDYGEPEAPSKR